MNINAIGVANAANGQGKFFSAKVKLAICLKIWAVVKMNSYKISLHYDNLALV